MTRRMLKSKLHRAVVTEADLEYEGSIAIDENLLEAADILPFEQVAVWNVTNGNRFETYAIPADAGSGRICVNGAAARLVSRGDEVIIASWTELDDAAARKHKPRVVLMNKNNTIKLAALRDRRTVA